MLYFIKTPGWLKKVYTSCTWNLSVAEKVIYLSFDDGPHPQITPFVLEHLQQYNARATFFCIGKNVVNHPEVYQKILTEGHAVGNHTFNHLNGWRTKTSKYITNIEQVKEVISSTLFRPPYGKITFRQLRALASKDQAMKVIMWSVLSADFDTNISPRACLNNVLKNAGQGDIIVFHDSEKAFDRMKYALPKTLEYFSNLGYRFEKIPC
jgi:peptidoglycan-N-acetylglucosamine deacetylase